MAAKKDKKPQDISKATVVAELTVSSPLGDEIILSFDKAWHRALELPTPVYTKFNRWARVD